MVGSGIGLSLWPKLLLWGTVIVIGFLYLVSVERQGGSHDRDRTAIESADPKLVEGTGARETGVAGTDLTAGAAGAGGQVDSAPGAEKEAAADQTAAHQAIDGRIEQAQTPADLESQTAPLVDQAVVEATTMAEETVAVGSALVAPAVAEDVPGGQGSDAQPAAAGGASRPAEAVLEQSHPVAVEPPAEVTPKDAEASAKAVSIEDGAQEPVSVGQATRTQEMAQRPQKTLGASLRGPEFVRRGSAQEGIEARRARILAEYEAMRKSYQEQMRRRWDQRGMPVRPGAGPYPGYPRSER